MVAAAPRERPTAYLRYVRVRRAAVVISALSCAGRRGRRPLRRHQPKQNVWRGSVPRRRRASAKSGGPQVAALHRVRCGFAGVQRMDRGRAARVVEDADPYKGTRDPDIPVFAAKRFFPSGSDILHGPPRRLRRRRQLPRCISDRSMSASAGAGTAARR